MAKKIYRKKLTNSGAGVCILTGLAAVLACCAAAGDLLAALIYGRFYTRQVYPMYPSVYGQIRNYGGVYVTAVFAVIMFIWALSAARGKRLGREFGLMGIFMGAAFCIVPAERIYTLLTPDFIDSHFKTGFDNDVFIGVVELARPGLPALAGLLLILAGISAAARLGGDDFVVETPRAVKRPKPAQKTSHPKAEDDFPDPRAFGDGKTVVEQGLTGETKPATYNEHSEDKHEPKSEEKPEPAAVIPEKEDKPAKRPTVKLCPKCGELVGEDELFCANCGQKM